MVKIAGDELYLYFCTLRLSGELHTASGLGRINVISLGLSRLFPAIRPASWTAYSTRRRVYDCTVRWFDVASLRVSFQSNQNEQVNLEVALPDTKPARMV